jgi:hypothetical protein
VPKLIAMFIPGAGFISAIISIYDIVMVFVEKISKIIQVVTAFIDSIVIIAAGNITAAAKRVENILAGLLSLAISFLAGFLRLGNVADKIKEVIEKVRASVDKAIDGAIAWIVDKAKKLYGSAKAAAGKVIQWWKGKAKFTADGENHNVMIDGGEDNPQIVIKSTLKTFLGYLKNITDSPKKDKAKDLARTIEEKAKPTKNEADKANQAENKRNAFNELAILLGELTNDEEVPASQVTYGGVTAEGGGTEMTANPLTIKHLDGEAADVNVPIYENLAGLRKGKGPPYYVQGHLLNRGLGGSGRRFNLTPLTTSANGLHYNHVEKVIKRWFKAPTKAKAVFYHVNTGPYYSKQNLTLTGTLAEKTAEGKLVNYILCTAHVLEKKNGKWEKKDNQPSEEIKPKIDNI